MQSLTDSASVPKRKRACNSCRGRKKRCDGERPTCSLCRKWGLRCEYTAPSTHRVDQEDLSLPYMSTLFGRQPFFSLDPPPQSVLDVIMPPDDSFDLPGISMPGDMAPQNEYLTPTTMLDPFSLDAPRGSDPDVFEEAALPTGEILTQLIDIFFQHFYYRFPFFHRATFFKQLHAGAIHAECELLLYAICTVASGFHPDPSIKSRQNAWYEQAKFLYEFTGRLPNPALRTIQASLCLIFHAYTRGDFSVCWLYVGKAWRQAASLGMNRIDSSNTAVVTIGRKDGLEEGRGYLARYGWTTKSAIDREECRRTLWLLFMMDRNDSWPTGWPTVVDERQFKIDIPTTDAVFQAMTDDTDISTTTNAPFTRNLNALISSTSTAKTPLNPFHYLVVTHVLLGRVIELIHSLHDSPDTPEYAQECEDLDNSLMKLRLNIPRSATSVLEASPEDRDHIIWLNLILNTISILIHYRKAGLSSLSNPNASSSASNESFTHAVLAARNTAQIVKDTSRISIDLLLSAHIASSVYIAGCVLVIHWRTTGDDSCKGDIEIFELLFERMSDVFTVLGLKFKLAIKRDQEREDVEIEKLRDAGYKGLLADCSKWGFVAEEAAKIGITIT
ncbi:hypothetical protein P280DRAFT_553235 [Massarina eburnea CBS 473.64]|uniref:Zn(2)-C6 fungal-type domain-containing protein n=1 Tax=Massarina eburnea CBS 473.64 TaxID=1395130 RepID=A0A6A6RNT0_9PLEO|nr:hypothetical protein P280DRAFT_553235 [Massarina eburnea CBS 473.64]